MSSHDPRPLLNEILNFLKENQIDDNLKDINKSIENLKKNEGNKTTKNKLKKVLGNLFAPSIIISILIFCINSQNQKLNSPLEYTLNAGPSIPKITDSNEAMSLQPFSSFYLKQNNGGKVKKLFLVTLNKENTPSIYAPIIDNNYNSIYQNNQKEIQLSDEPLLIWNPKINLIDIYFPNISLNITNNEIASGFLILKGHNGSYSIITLLHKIGTVNENLKDTTISFTDLEIYDKRVWKEKTLNENYELFIKNYDDTIKNYQSITNWIKSISL